MNMELEIWITPMPWDLLSSSHDVWGMEAKRSIANPVLFIEKHPLRTILETFATVEDFCNKAGFFSVSSYQKRKMLMKR